MRRGLARARELGLATSVIPRAQFTDASAFEAALLGALDAQAHDLLVLAGFMRILSSQFVARYAGRMVNIHPSLLPLYRGLNTHRRVLGAGDTHHGASVHFVTADLDSGPVVLQSRVPVLPDDTEKTVAETRASERAHHLSEGHRLDWRNTVSSLEKDACGSMASPSMSPWWRTSVRSHRSDCRALGGTVIWLAVAVLAGAVRAASAAAAAEDPADFHCEICDRMARHHRRLHHARAHPHGGQHLYL